jgi:hypothetical protein
MLLLPLKERPASASDPNPKTLTLNSQPSTLNPSPPLLFSVFLGMLKPKAKTLQLTLNPEP